MSILNALILIIIIAAILFFFRKAASHRHTIEQHFLTLPPFVVSSQLHHAAFWMAEQPNSEISDIVHLLEFAVKLAPNNADAYNELGFCHQRSGNFFMAQEAAERAVAWAPGNPKFRCSLITARLAIAEAQRSKQAIADSAFNVHEDIVMLVDRYPWYAPSYLLWARMLALCGEPATEWVQKHSTARNAYAVSDKMGSGLNTSPSFIETAIDNSYNACQKDHGLWSNALDDLDLTVSDYWKTEPLPSRLGPYDLFISYASEDVETVRYIVNWLITSGVTVWFAEYQVFLSGREAWETSVRYGISKSKTGIIFAGPQYPKKETCKLERKLLEKQQETPIIVIDLSPLEQPESIGQQIVQNRYDKHDLLVRTMENVQTKLLQHIPEPAPLYLPDSSRIRTNNIKEFPFGGKKGRLTTSNWDILRIQNTSETDNAEECRIELSFTEKSNCLRANVVGQYVVDFDTLNQSFDGNDQILEDARKRSQEMTTSLRGVHSLIHQGHCHTAVTYKTGNYWFRKVWLYIQPTETNQANLKILFEFTFKYTGCFKHYCWYTYQMDKLVKSLQWPIEKRQEPLCSRMTSTKLQSNTKELMASIPWPSGINTQKIIMSHYISARNTVGGQVVNLKLDNADTEPQGICLTYKWQENLTHHEVDVLDTRVRAFINCIIGSTAEAAGLGLKTTKRSVKLASVPVLVPGWLIEGFSQSIPVLVVASEFDVNKKNIQLHVGTYAFKVSEKHPSNADRLLKQFQHQWKTIDA